MPDGKTKEGDALLWEAAIKGEFPMESYYHISIHQARTAFPARGLWMSAMPPR